MQATVTLTPTCSATTTGGGLRFVLNIRVNSYLFCIILSLFRLDLALSDIDNHRKYTFKMARILESIPISLQRYKKVVKRII